MRNIKLTIEYDGSHLNGWQEQPGKTRTVQGLIRNALKKIIDENVVLIGSGRTDSGVHARGQVAHFKMQSRLSAKTIANALNAHLPDDIAIIDAVDVDLKFHAQYSVRSKVYRYSILNRPSRTALNPLYFWHYPHPINVSRMKREARYFLGKQDFKSFQATDKARASKSSVRYLKRITIVKKGDIITIDLEADGFLYKMVRNIVGSLVEVASGKRPEGSLKKILKIKDRKEAGFTAPASGLTLWAVNY